MVDSLIEGKINQVSNLWQAETDFRVSPEGPKSLAIICDGNRRAAREWGLPPFLGHRVGVEAIKGISKATRGWGIENLTFWVWSTENWSRDSEQVEFVMQLAQEFLPQQELLDELTQDKVRFTHLGRKDRLPPTLLESLDKLETATQSFDTYYLSLALDYGGLDEMARAIKTMFVRFKEGEFNPDLLTQKPEVIYGFLDTKGQVLPDLVVRTGVEEGEVAHTSGFLPLQTAYAGWDFIDDLFPNLTPNRLMNSIRKFENYRRRMGK